MFSVSDQDDILQVETYEKIEKQFIVLPLYRGVVVRINVVVLDSQRSRT